MSKRLKHADINKLGDELCVMQLLDGLEGKSNFEKAKTIVKGLRKRMHERHIENERLANIARQGDQE